MLARIGAALDSEIVALGAGPTHLRVTGPTTLSGAIDVKTSQERRRRAAVRLAAQPGPHDAAQGRPHRGGQPAPRGAEQPRRAAPAGSTPTTTSRSSRPTRARPGRASTRTAARRTRSIIMFLGPLLHRARRRSSCRTPAAATSAPAPSSRTWRRCGRSASRSRRPTGSYHAQVDRGDRADAARSCSPSAATPSPRTP